MTKQPSKSIAYHEAGHAVVGRALGLPVTLVEVFARDRRPRQHVGGRTRVSKHDLTTHQQLIYCWAGPLAEARYRKRSAGEMILRGMGVDGSDIDRVTALHEEFPEPLRNALGEAACEAARQHVADRWNDIKALAERLVREGSVSFK